MPWLKCEKCRRFYGRLTRIPDSDVNAGGLEYCGTCYEEWLEKEDNNERYP
jgi:hypothetical protein